MKPKRTKKLRTQAISIRVDEIEMAEIIEKANRLARGNVSFLIRLALAAFNG